MKSKPSLPFRISGAINGVLALAALAAVVGGIFYGLFTLIRDRVLPFFVP